MAVSGTEYIFRTADGSDLLPVADGEFVIEGMDAKFTFGNCFIQFYSSDGTTAVTPTAGTIQFEAGIYPDQYLDPPSSATINATDVTGDGVATYTTPSFDSAVKFSRVVFAGITGASFARAMHWRG